MGTRLRWALLLVKGDLRLVGFWGSLSLDTSRPQLIMGLQKGREKKIEGITAFSACPSGLVTEEAVGPCIG